MDNQKSQVNMCPQSTLTTQPRQKQGHKKTTINFMRFIYIKNCNFNFQYIESCNSLFSYLLRAHLDKHFPPLQLADAVDTIAALSFDFLRQQIHL